jgi:uncharacterized protein (TIGR03118 family)
LQNPWGFSHNATGGPFWISNNDTNTATLYTVTDGTKVRKFNINPPSGFVGIPTTGTGEQDPTGQVSNGNPSAFGVGHGGNGGSARFIFAEQNGTISAWDTGPKAFTQVTTAGASYTGLAINQTDTLLYAANNAGAGSVDVFNRSFARVTTLPAGAFATPSGIRALNLIPFNVQDIGGNVYVTYSLLGNVENQAVAGQGAVAVFSENGSLKQTIIGGQLASPWGVALAPPGFGQFGGDLLVGNQSHVDSEINTFNPATGAFEGSIAIDPGAGNLPGGLWAIGFGGGGSNGSPNTLFFNDGINGETDGLFGSIAAVPEPSTWAMLLADLADSRSGPCGGAAGPRRSARRPTAQENRPKSGGSLPGADPATITPGPASAGAGDHELSGSSIDQVVVQTVQSLTRLELTQARASSVDILARSKDCECKLARY